MARSRISELQATVVGGRLFLSGTQEQQLLLLSDRFFKQLGGLPSDRARDLLHIAVAIYGVDRCVRRDARSQDWIRDLHLKLSVRDIAFWSDPAVKERLHQIATFLSDDNWAFDFVSDTSQAPSLSENYSLRLDPSSTPKIALYSGGLDSAAGLALRCLEGQPYQLVTVIHQSSLHRLVATQLRELRERTRLALVPAFFAVHLHGGSAERLRLQEQTQRCRALLFCSAAALAATVNGAAEIEVFENGVGALNVPLMTGMLFGGRATRGAHPRFLELMSDLASRVAERPIKYSLPFRDMTKAEMVHLAAQENPAEWLLASRSCIHTSLRVPGKHHCGVCPACVSRRQACVSGGVQEHVEDYGQDVFAASEQALADLDQAYLRLELLMARQLERDEDSSALRRFRRHIQTSNACASPEDEAKWLGVQRRYAKEWCALARRLPVLDRWSSELTDKVAA